MIGVEQWAEIRRLYLARGWKKRAIDRNLGLQRRTVDRALASEVSPRYQRASRPSCLDGTSRRSTRCCNAFRS